MYRIDNDTAAAALPTPAAVGPNPDGYFTDGDPGSAIPATVVDADWANAVQEEITYVIEESGATLDKADNTQLKIAIDTMIAASVIGAAASETVAGIAEIATQAETDAGTDDARIVTPEKLKQNLLNTAMHVQDQKSSGTDGGTFTAGSYVTRTLNTSVFNNITGASLGSNQITLPAGTYSIQALACALDTGNHKIKLYNVTDAANVLIGISENNTQGSADPVSTNATLHGYFTIAGTKVFEIRHQCSNTQTTNGFGSASSFGDVEVYCDVLIHKIG